MILDCNSVWYLSAIDGFRPGVKIAEDCPDYVIDWFKKHKDNIELSDTEYNPEDTFDWPIKADRWPKPEELNTKKYCMVKGDYDHQARRFGYEPTTSLKFGSLWWPRNPNEHYEKLDKEIPPINGEIVQFMKLYGYDKEKSNYRRFKLSAYLQEKYGDKYFPIVDVRKCPKEGKFKYAIISTSVGWEVVTAYKYDYLIYDRTDNWSAWGKNNAEEEQRLLDKADLIFTSSKWLYEDTLKRAKTDTTTVIYVPNGCDVKEYKPVEKYPETTLCYIGKTDNKVDWDYVKTLADKYKIKVYGAIEEQFEHPNVEWCGFLPEEVLHREISKCHYGLIPFNEGEWTAAMLPLKLFHYANAHIPTIYRNCPECDAYPTIASTTFDINPADSDYVDVLKSTNWREKFDYMLEEIYGIDS